MDKDEPVKKAEVVAENEDGNEIAEVDFFKTDVIGKGSSFFMTSLVRAFFIYDVIGKGLFYL